MMVVRRDGSKWSKGAARGRWIGGPLVLAGLFAAITILLGAPIAAATPALKWSGGASIGSRGWSNNANWEGGVIPSSSEPAALEFPMLTSQSCTIGPPNETCYESENDMSGLAVESMHVEDSQTYVIAGNPITLGEGGLSAAPATNTTEQAGSILFLPIALGAGQAWSIAGQSGDTAIDGNQLVLLREVTGNHPLNAVLSEGGGLVLVNEDEVGPLGLEGAESGRAGILNGVVELYGAQLNASDHEPVSFKHVFVIGTGATGPLMTSAAEIVVEPGEESVERLEVQNATFDPESRLIFIVTDTGTVAGREYAQITSAGPVDINGAELAVAAQDSCRALWPGTTYTFLTSTGSIAGSFGNAGEGKEIPVKFPKGCTIAQSLQIHYSRSGGTQTVTGTVIAGATSTTTLEASPAAPITNQGVTLIATVRASAETPSGKVEFDDGGKPIPGCAGQPLIASGSHFAATCQTSFAASGSPQQLSAEFLPGVGVNVKSSSTTDDLVVGRAPTTTSLQLSSTTPPVNQNVTYTATVSTSANGLIQPGGTVAFADNGTPIGSCAAQPLQGAVSTCLLSYPSQGAHSITANYSGDPNFAASSSASETLTVPPLETRFFVEAEPGEAKVNGTLIPVRGRALAVVKLTCHGLSSCKGTLTLSVRETAKGKHGRKTYRTVKIGSEAFSIAAGKTASIDVRLNKTGRTLLRNQKKGQISATLKLAQGPGSTQANIHLTETKPGAKNNG